MKTITADTLIGDLLKDSKVDEIAEVLFGVGMHCLGCAIAHGETVGQAAEAHNVDIDKLIADLNVAANS
ncbi:MAG: DUF1858 domain-containing protein [Clostridia bacterium]